MDFIEFIFQYVRSIYKFIIHFLFIFQEEIDKRIAQHFLKFLLEVVQAAVKS